LIDRNFSMRSRPIPLALGLLALAAGTAFAVPLPATSESPAVRPGDDFDRYANSAWMSTTALPPAETSYGPTAMLKARNADRVRSIIETAARAPDGTADATDRALEQKIADFYASFADGRAIEETGLSPLTAKLDAIAGIADRRELSATLGRTLGLDDGSNTQTDGIFGVWVHQGFDEADRNLPHIVQGGLGLGTPDVYLDASKAGSRADYRAHVAHVLALAGHPNAEAEAADVLALETAIAKTHASREDTDDILKANNHWRRADFAKKAPGTDWAAYFRAAGLDRQTQFIVWQPSAVAGTAALVASEPIAAWKAYLTFHTLDHYSSVLPRAIARSSEQPPADRRPLAIAATNAALGEAIGRLYVERYFPPRAKAAAAAMAENLRGAFRVRIAKLAWMSPETRAKALAKLAALKIGVGYPDHWTDYSSLRIERGDSYGNMERAERFAYLQGLAKLREPVDPGEWSALLPQTVGAVINFSPNAIQFSAGILQPPYFDPDGDAASNYGSAGAGMAHEISHSFDLLGNLYDAQGRFGNWWSAQDVARFHDALAPLVAQFDAYCPRPRLCLNGKRMLGENIADLAGLRSAYDAYHLSLGGRRDRTIEGLSGDQRFFLAFARRWQKLQTEAALRHDVEADIHAPGPYRSDTVRNVDEWYAAFGIKPGDELYLSPEHRVRVW
jgi:putative endopeptidase